MRICTVLRCAVVLFLPFGLSHPANSASTEATTILAQANQAFSAGKPVTSVTMTGTAQWTVGSTKDSGPAKLTANVNGESNVELDLSSGTRIENQSSLAGERTCTWSGADGVSHTTASSNCWTATSWFLPHLALQSSGLPTALGATYLGLMTEKSQTFHKVEYQLTYGQGQADLPATSLIQSWSTMDLAIDPTTFLPSALKYSIHPDDNSSVNIKVDVRYSNYQNVSGVELPMHIERYVNGSLQLSIDITSAVVN